MEFMWVQVAPLALHSGRNSGDRSRPVRATWSSKQSIENDNILPSDAFGVPGYILRILANLNSASRDLDSTS